MLRPLALGEVDGPTLQGRGGQPRLHPFDRSSQRQRRSARGSWASRAARRAASGSCPTASRSPSCRGPYYVFARDAVQLLRQPGRRARRLAGGLPEWRLAGPPVASGKG